VLCLLAVCLSPLYAGSQREEPLADAVRTALTAAVNQLGPPLPVHADAQSEQRFAQWLMQMEVRLSGQLQPRDATEGTSERMTHELATRQARREFLQTVLYESQRAGLDPALVLGLIQVESGFRKFAISSAGARGFMQVMPFWTRVLSNGEAGVLFQTQANLRFGCVILRHYLALENGNLTLALGRYNGSRGQLAYPNAVLAAQKKWALPGP
jgi:soluble lytic murein transglycosylase-like protein